MWDRNRSILRFISPAHYLRMAMIQWTKMKIERLRAENDLLENKIHNFQRMLVGKGGLDFMEARIQMVQWNDLIAENRKKIRELIKKYQLH